MALPAVSIPDFPLPFHVPVEVHPCVVHLAVALPIVILLIELVNLVAKKRALGVFSFVLMVLLAVILFGAYLTGTADAKEAGSVLESGAVKSLFVAHKTQGIYLVYSALVLVVIKLLSVLVRKTPMRVLFLLFLIAFTALTLNTAKKGKSLVFDYGVNVKTTASAPAAQEPKAHVAEEHKAAAAAEAPQKVEEEHPAAAQKAPIQEAKPEAPAAEAAPEAAKSEPAAAKAKEEPSAAKTPAPEAEATSHEAAPAAAESEAAAPAAATPHEEKAAVSE